MKNTKLIKRYLIIPCICFVVFFVLHLLGAFQSFENKTYDQRMKFTAQFTYPSDDIAFIEVNQESLDWALENYGWSWPWPRESYARIIEFLSAGNVKAIAFDMLYNEPSLYGPQDDEKLALAEKESGKVVQTVFTKEENGKEARLLPIEQIENEAALLGSVVSIKDSDDMIRRSRFTCSIDGYEYYSLGFAPLFLTGETQNIENLPYDKENALLLRYRENLDSYAPFQACDILSSYDAWKNGEEGIFVPEDFDDLYVFFALYAPGLFDICSSPVSKVYPGVGVHITALDNYLTDSFMHKCSLWLEVLWYLLMAFLGCLCINFASKLKHLKANITAISIGGIIGLMFGIAIPVLIFMANYWLSIIGPVLCFVTSFVATLIMSFNQEGKQKRFIKAAFSQCLSKEVVQQIMDNPESFTLGGKKYQMSALFSDIEKFSSFSELLSAGELGVFLNYYLTRMSDVIIEEKGTIDKYEGDAIVALIGAPLEMENHSEQACRAAVRMKKAEKLMNQEICEIGSKEDCPADMDKELFAAFKCMYKNNKKLFTRIGINSGEMIAGYFGSEKKKNYTMMGNNVNLASRLEGVNKQYHTGGILISEATRQQIGDIFVVRSLDKVKVVNVEKPIQLYEVLDLKNEAGEKQIEQVELWEKAMDFYVQENYKAAYDQFTAFSKENPDDKVALYYISLLEKYFLKGTFPQEKDDEGVVYLPQEKVFKLLQK